MITERDGYNALLDLVSDENGAGTGSSVDRAERSVLATMMLDPEAIGQVRAVLDTKAFNRTAHQKIYGAILALADRGGPADYITAVEELRRRGDLQAVGGPQAVTDLLENYGTAAANVYEHAGIVGEAATKRLLRRLGEDLQSQAEDPGMDSAAILSGLSAAEIRISAVTPFRGGSGRNHSGGFLTARELSEQVPAQVPWLVRPWVATGAVTELVGKVKGGKSTLLAAMVKALVTGGTFLGEQVARSRVVWLTEQSPATFRALLSRVGLEISDDLLVLPWHAVRDMAWEAVATMAARRARDFGAGLLIVDTLGQFAGLRGDGENNAAEALTAMRPLQAAAADGLAVSVARHERKSGGEVGDSGRGSSAYAGAVDVVVALRRPEGASRPTIRALHAVSRFDETPPELMVEWTDATYKALGESRDVSMQEAKAGLFNEAPEGEQHALTIDGLLARLPNVRRTVAQDAIKALLANGALQQAGAGKRNDPRRYYRPMVSAGSPAGSGGNNEGGL